MIHLFRHIKLQAALVVTLLSLHSGFAQEQEFRIPKSMVESAERRLSNERDPERRLQLVLRWIRIKEEYEQTLIEEGQDPQKAQNMVSAKKQIVAQLKKELQFFTPLTSIDYSQLYRELGFRTLELGQIEEAVYYFELLKDKTPQDQLAYGDALIANKAHEEALKAYTRASLDPQLEAMSWYKRAWVHMQLNSFEDALMAFDKALENNPHSTVQLREEAFKDRLKPFIETHTKETFDEQDDRNLRILISRLYPQQEEKVRELYINTLERLIGGFNAKAQVDKARAVFTFLEKKIQDPDKVLVVAAPIWLKVYRSQLNHDKLEEIVRALPSRDISQMEGVNALRAQLNNTAVFYQTMAEEDNPEAKKDFRKEANRLLVLTYEKYFEAFPLDKEVDPLRINYASILLDRGEAESCLGILENRGGKEPEIEKLATNLEGKCEFRRLEELYEKPATPRFFDLLARALFEIKLYERSDLGVPSEKVYESLIRMIFGSLQSDPKNERLRKMLLKAQAEFPYDKEDPLFREIQITIAELRFDDLIALKEDDKLKGLDDQFFKIFEFVPSDTAVAQKALTNSILLGRTKEALNRCDSFRENYKNRFVSGGEVGKRCIRLAERFLELEKEYAYLKAQRVPNTKARQFHLLTIELALGDDSALRKIERLGTTSSHNFMNLWEGKNVKPVPPPPGFKRLKRKANQLLSTLKPITFSSIGFEVPKRTKAFETFEKRWESFFNRSGSDDLWRAESLLVRSKVAQKMAEWMKALPEPPGLSEEELNQYRTQAQNIKDTWNQKAKTAQKECAENAYPLSRRFQPTEEESESFCEEETPRTTLKEYLTAWNETRQMAPERKPWEDDETTERFDIVADLIETGLNSKDENRGKYFLIRAYDLSKSNYYKARALLGLAKLVDRDSYWISAHALDGNLVEPIYWLKDRSQGNPFYQRLYSQKIRVAER